MADAEKTEKAEMTETPGAKTPASPRGGASSGVPADLGELETTLSQTMAAREASLSMGMKVRLGVLVVVLLYFSFLYYLVAGFTADQALLMARGQLDAELPQMQRETVEKMKASAPEVVTQYTNNLVDSVPSMRVRLEEEMLANTHSVLTQMKADLNRVFLELLKESKTELDKMGKDLSTAQKLDRLSKEMRVRFFEERTTVVEGISKEFRSTVQKLNGQLLHLQTGKNLSKAEQHQREMLRVWSKLMQIKMKDVNKQFHEETQNLTR